jgi:cyclopropane fatty-acyl-phospholipid synthase-like methyltransferase
VIALLDLQPGDNILELGCGEDAAMHRLLETRGDVSVVGVDTSADAIGRAREKNAQGIAAGRAMLVQTDAARSLPSFAAPFTRAVAVNAALPEKKAAAIMWGVRRAMAPGSRIAVAVLPRGRETTAAEARRIGDGIRSLLEASEFIVVKLHEKILGPTAAICVTGITPGRQNKRAPRVISGPSSL